MAALVAVPAYVPPAESDLREFVAMMCIDGNKIFPWIGEVQQSRGELVWLAHSGELLVSWMQEGPEPRCFVFSNNVVDDAQWFPAGEFICKVAMKPRDDGSWFLSAQSLWVITHACSLAKQSVEAYRAWLGVPRGVGSSGAAPTSRKAMLSRMLRDAVHIQLRNKVKVGCALVYNQTKDAVLELLPDAEFGRFQQTQREGSPSMVWVFNDKAALTGVMGGAGWDSVFTKGDTGFNFIITREIRAGQHFKLPIRLTFCESTHRTFGLRGYGRIRLSFKFRRNDDLSRKLEHH